jgi:predicted nucleic acid-binding protein
VRVVIDSSVLIDHLRGDERARDVLRRRVNAGEELWGVVIARAEVLAGMRAPERRQTELLLDQLRWLDIDVELADAAGATARRLRRSHPGLQLADCLIAAGTAQLGASLLTQNVRHFPMIPDLTPAYPPKHAP